ncbi:hypothetical protein SB49_00330 [Sediminicola sp. YIK13]|uniref:hypothetical protein n=1 Tax=Sediminicola sp. YIK13 TaxID=1453352 RepID=UPI000720C6BC|nr:hypothetical protein [Sediminicola sp. YIK13]ALM06429.1 hypothetical protein SB49_00330 [Sediminicola sp. YIK13]
MENVRRCKSCQKELTGRKDKRYCDVYCKSAHQYQVTKTTGGTLFRQIDSQLKKNRSILKGYNKSGMAKVRSEVLLKEGFDPNFFTHYWKNKKGDVYLFVYEYGFLKRNDRGRDKYVLVLLQEYMKPPKAKATS